jgi:hypothetical protein
LKGEKKMKKKSEKEKKKKNRSLKAVERQCVRERNEP